MRSYCMSTSRRRIAALVVLLADAHVRAAAPGTPRVSRGRRCSDTDATTMTSRRVSRAEVAEWRSRSISSLTDESFSM